MVDQFGSGGMLQEVKLADHVYSWSASVVGIVIVPDSVVLSTVTGPYVTVGFAGDRFLCECCLYRGNSHHKITCFNGCLHQQSWVKLK